MGQPGKTETLRGLNAEMGTPRSYKVTRSHGGCSKLNNPLGFGPVA